MNPLKSLIFCGSLLISKLDHNPGLSTFVEKPGALSLSAELKQLPLRNLELRDQALANATLRALRGLDGEALEIFEQDHQRWAELRKAFFSNDAGGARAAAELNEQELTNWTDEVRRRTSWIHGLMDYRRNQDKSGFWSDGCGGHFSLVEQGGKLYFMASCIRGEGRYQGAIQGCAMRIGQKAVYSVSEYDDEPTHLEFSFEKPWIILKGTNTAPYHGLLAYFDGCYAKIAPLSAEERQLVLKATQKP
jgi:hypothetical protein